MNLEDPGATRSPIQILQEENAALREDLQILTGRMAQLEARIAALEQMLALAPPPARITVPDTLVPLPAPAIEATPAEAPPQIPPPPVHVNGLPPAELPAVVEPLFAELPTQTEQLHVESVTGASDPASPAELPAPAAPLPRALPTLRALLPTRVARTAPEVARLTEPLESPQSIELPAPAARWRRWIKAGLFLLGLALTAGGLSILRSRQEFPDLPRPLIVALADFNFGNSEAFIVGGLLALLGIILVAGGRPGYPPEPVNAWRLPLLRYQPDKLGWAILGLTMIGNGILYSSLASKHYSHWDILLFGGGLLLTTLAVRRLVRPAEPPRPLPLTRLDLAVAVGLALGTFAVNSVDLTRWNFAWVGDEGSFFNAAHDALRAGSNWPWNFFDLLVLYNQFPMLDTLYQGLGLRIFGADIVGWRLTEVLVTAMTSVLLYWQVTVLLGRLPAIAAAVTVAASHYLMAFARIGYNNTHMIFYAALTFLLLTLTVYTRRPGFLFTTGVAMGFCLYTIQGAYLVWPTVASLLLIGWIRRPTWRYVFPVGLLAGGFVLVVLPAVLNTPIDRLLQALTFQTRRENPTMDAAHVLHTNVAGSFVALWDNYQAANHYVSGPLVDFITGLLLLLGLAIALTRLRQGAAQLALAWFGFGIVLLPISTYMLGVPLTRLLYVIPAVALLVGIAVGALEQILVAHLRIPARGSQALVLALLALIPILNLQQLLVISPSQLDVNDQIMFMKEIQEHPAQVVVEVGLRPEVSGNLTQMLSWYPWLQGRYRYIGVADLPAGGLPETGPARTIYLVDQQNVKLGLGRVVAAKLPPGYQRVADRSPRGNYEVQLFIAAADHASPANERAAVPQAHH